MSSRAKKLRDQNVVVTLIKDLNKRMSDFEESVTELKILKDSIMEMNDEIVKQETENTYVLQKLKTDLKENKTKILNETASEIGKVIISRDELKELEDEVTKLKSSLNNFKTNSEDLVRQKVEEQVENKLKLQKLQFDCQTAQLIAENDNYKKQVENLNESINRMSSELDSQKQLTADVARVGRISNDNKV